jgi:hypothetical protein
MNICSVLSRSRGTVLGGGWDNGSDENVIRTVRPRSTTGRLDSRSPGEERAVNSVGRQGGVPRMGYHSSRTIAQSHGIARTVLQGPAPCTRPQPDTKPPHRLGRFGDRGARSPEGTPEIVVVTMTPPCRAIDLENRHADTVDRTGISLFPLLGSTTNVGTVGGTDVSSAENPGPPA